MIKIYKSFSFDSPFPIDQNNNGKIDRGNLDFFEKNSRKKNSVRVCNKTGKEKSIDDTGGGGGERRKKSSERSEIKEREERIRRRRRLRRIRSAHHLQRAVTNEFLLSPVPPRLISRSDWHNTATNERDSRNIEESLSLFFPSLSSDLTSPTLCNYFYEGEKPAAADSLAVEN